MASTFRATRYLTAPRWLTDGEGGVVGYALDLIKDALAERLYQGLMVRFPQQDPDGTPAADDALTIMGRERRVVRGLSETSTEYAVRLKSWLDDRRLAGTPYMLMQKLAEYLGPLASFRTVDDRGNWYSRSALGVETALLKQENWDWSGDPVGERWSRFWVIIYPNGVWADSDQEWGDVGNQDWGDVGHTWGTTATEEHVRTVRSIVADWMTDGTRCINIIIALDPASFDPSSPEPDGLWERWSKNVAGVQVPARLSTARYWDGVTR
jgi:hypothetical protein